MRVDDWRDFTGVRAEEGEGRAEEEGEGEGGGCPCWWGFVGLGCVGGMCMWGGGAR